MQGREGKYEIIIDGSTWPQGPNCKNRKESASSRASKNIEPIPHFPVKIH